ncbi:membrane glycoprotein yil173w precursor, putative [Perkinsus marinus ATCC 50983]|uniref:Membrane glycoprotein yil173w, putative n=1 Tax=Perkinsus marinus (strain ATCC 50983 / TXsc) TaxID=423536 RepID=C5KP64_PERM5|nr:membrane glycoprotein yil173w precursor, putative [Perkinsus marinus ATCC 50983]EER13739.1 membrane glycoprotein yil173w precursor, putative [Perkinsus marinus ATCC 50983]|eukprot:XP_002781944.1 membrane glycoprotein yil173w precursor, putative [Perkinsus marinus ATCC 50983]
MRAFILLLTLLLSTALQTTNKKVSVKEVVFDSAVADMLWLGIDNKVVLVRTTRGRIYRSINGGDVWDEITNALVSSGSATTYADYSSSGSRDFYLISMVANDNDKNMVVAVSNHRVHFISDDAGQRWRVVKYKGIHSYVFHPTRSQWALMSTWTEACESRGMRNDADVDPCHHSLFLTQDGGRTFLLVQSYVVQFDWGDKAFSQEDRIYLTHFRFKSGDQPKLTLWSAGVDFAYSDDMGHTFYQAVSQGNKFLISNGFIFVAKLVDKNSQSVKLMVSADGGEHFTAARLPVKLEEKSYTILDTSEGAVMLHVNHDSPGSGGVGNVYVSDKDGVRYSLSLPNNVRGSNGDCEFDKVLSLEGVYMANFMDTDLDNDGYDEEISVEGETEDASFGMGRQHGRGKAGKDESMIRTVISFDKGSVWSYLIPPRVDSRGKAIECPRDRCFLHLHGITNFHNYAPFYSLETAVGLIMGTGNVGPYLRFENDEVNTYLSRDGGLTWIEAHKGAYIYEFGDHGGLVVMADDIHKTRQVVFSWNEGHSWYDFDVSEHAMAVDNIVTEPTSTSTKFLMHGTRSDAGVLYHIDFDTLGQPPCQGAWAADSAGSDYETWIPSDGRTTGDACLLGRVISYVRRKKDSECFNGEKFERPVIRHNCPCTKEDFDCELGFARKIGSVDCKPVDVDACTSSGMFFADAYRKVVGDTCEGGWRPQKERVPCPSHSPFSRGAVATLMIIGFLVALMFGGTYVSGSERWKNTIGNYGFETLEYVKYSTIGRSARLAVSATDDMNPDDFDDAPQLEHYSSNVGKHKKFDETGEELRSIESPRSSESSGEGGGGVPDLLGIDDEDEDSTDSTAQVRMRSGGLASATGVVPRLQPPPTGPASRHTNAEHGDDGPLL